MVSELIFGMLRLLIIYTILPVFKVTNVHSAGDGVCDLAVYTDTDVGGHAGHYLGSIPNGHGVYWSGLYSGFFYVLNVLGGDFPRRHTLVLFTLVNILSACE
jgi:hypothetical protein